MDIKNGDLAKWICALPIFSFFRRLLVQDPAVPLSQHIITSEENADTHEYVRYKWDESGKQEFFRTLNDDTANGQFEQFENYLQQQDVNQAVNMLEDIYKRAASNMKMSNEVKMIMKKSGITMSVDRLGKLRSLH